MVLCKDENWISVILVRPFQLWIIYDSVTSLFGKPMESCGHIQMKRNYLWFLCVEISKLYELHFS